MPRMQGRTAHPKTPRTPPRTPRTPRTNTSPHPGHHPGHHERPPLAGGRMRWPQLAMAAAAWRCYMPSDRVRALAGVAPRMRSGSHCACPKLVPQRMHAYASVGRCGSPAAAAACRRAASSSCWARASLSLVPCAAAGAHVATRTSFLWGEVAADPPRSRPGSLCAASVAAACEVRRFRIPRGCAGAAASAGALASATSPPAALAAAAPVWHVGAPGPPWPQRSAAGAVASTTTTPAPTPAPAAPPSPPPAPPPPW